MKLRIGICDDEQQHMEQLQRLVNEWAETSGSSCELAVFPSAEAFLFAYEERKDFDILLLDIEMKQMSGVALAKQLRAEKSRAEIIFITSHFEFYGEGYEVDALHYLIKPVQIPKLFEVLDKAAARRAVQPPSVLITCDGETLRLYESEILYVEAMLHYLRIVTDTGEYRVKEKISAMEEQLSENFFRCHRSYLVSLQKIRRITRTAIQMTDGGEVPLSRGKYDEIHYAFIRQN